MGKPPTPATARTAARKGWNLGKRIAPPRFIAFTLVLIAASAAAAAFLSPFRGYMVGFDVAAVVFLLSLQPLLKCPPSAMRHHSSANDANRVVLLGVTGIVMAVILVSVAIELAGDPKPAAIVLVVVTLMLAWLFSNTVYALHYAHLFYTRGKGRGSDNGGVEFPDTKEPDYWDFIYFAWTLGMTFQTSDVAITAPVIRRVATFHCLAAFVFNLGILAFTINVLGG